MKNLFFLFVLSIFAISCGKSDNNIKPKDKAGSPCEILTESEMKDMLEFPSEAATTISEDNTSFPICSYKWEDVTFTYFLQIGNTPTEIEQAAEVDIVLVKNGSTAKYEASIKVYDDGQVQDGVGEMAMWSDKKRQITFLSKGHLIHTRVQVSGDESVNKAKAIALAKMMAGKL